MIPAPQLFDRDIKAIRNRNKRIATPHFIKPRMRGRRQGHHGNRQFVSGAQIVGSRDAVRLRDLTGATMKLGRDAAQRFAVMHNMEPPGIAFVVRDLLDTRREEIARPHRNMQIERHVARCRHAQQAWI